MEEGVKHSAHFLLFLSGDPEIVVAPSAEEAVPPVAQPEPWVAGRMGSSLPVEPEPELEPEPGISDAEQNVPKHFERLFGGGATYECIFSYAFTCFDSACPSRAYYFRCMPCGVAEEACEYALLHAHYDAAPTEHEPGLPTHINLRKAWIVDFEQLGTQEPPEDMRPREQEAWRRYQERWKRFQKAPWTLRHPRKLAKTHAF